MPLAIDSIHADSASLLIAGPGAISHADTLFVADIDAALAAPAIVVAPVATEPVVEQPAPPAWQQGLDGAPRAVSVGDNSGVLAILSGLFLLMMFSYRRCTRLFSQLWQELLGMRSRSNLFDERTSGENSALFMMAVQWSVSIGLLLYSGIGMSALSVAPSHAFSDTALLIALAGAYYVFQLCAYSVVGYVFSTPDGRRLYVRGFTASQSLLGFALIVPALVSIFYPRASLAMVTLSAALYLSARIVFLIKGLRIFYANFGSLLYFILYLCTLEIIPLMIVLKTAFRLMA